MKTQSYKKLPISSGLHILFYLMCSMHVIIGQNLLNASLEGAHQDATMPDNWLSATPGTTPDILPETWGERLEPAHGNSYVGLITRGNGTYEAITQRLPNPSKIETCYDLILSVARSPFYAGYNQPIRCRIWLSKTKGKRDRLISDLGLIKNEAWETHKLQYITDDVYYYIIFEAYHPKGIDRSEGNILLDHIIGPKECLRS